jgi:hypothetical protein
MREIKEYLSAHWVRGSFVTGGQQLMHGAPVEAGPPLTLLAGHLSKLSVTQHISSVFLKMWRSRLWSLLLGQTDPCVCQLAQACPILVVSEVFLYLGKVVFPGVLSAQFSGHTWCVPAFYGLS